MERFPTLTLDELRYAIKSASLDIDHQPDTPENRARFGKIEGLRLLIDDLALPGDTFCAAIEVTDKNHARPLTRN